MKDLILKLRNRETLTLLKKVTGYSQNVFVRIQINKAENFICWQRFYSLDRKNWRKQNDCLSLKEVVSILN